MNKERERRLLKAYAKVPKVKCKGLCTDQCTVLGMAPAEKEYIIDHCGVLPRPDEHGKCSELTADGRCAIYEHRPYVCRAYGAVNHPYMTCPHGCEIEGGALSEKRSAELLANIKGM